jgi:hypothetical protein
MKQFMPDVTPKERMMLLQDNAAKVEVTLYQKILSPEQLADRREDLADNMIKLNIKEDELNEIKGKFKVEMDPLKNKNKELLTEIKTKQQTIDGTLYHIPDYENKTMDTYDQEGIWITSRRLRPEENQGHIFSIKNAVNQ